MGRKTTLALLSGALLAAGCGGDDDSNGDAESAPLTSMEEIEVSDGPFETTEELAAAMDDVCTQANQVYATTPVPGFQLAGLAAEFETIAEQSAALNAKLAELTPPDEASADYEAYLAVLDERDENNAAIAEGAAAEDQQAVDAAFAEDDQLFEERAGLLEALGTEVCGLGPPVTAEPTGTGPAEDLEFPEPSNTIEEAAQEWLDADRSGDCEEALALGHSQGGYTPEICADDVPFYEAAELVGTEQYGPVGVATYDAGEDFFPFDNYFVVDAEADGALRNAGLLPNLEGGIKPAGEGNEADENAQAVVDAIRADDPDAFNELLLVDVAPDFPGFQVEGDSFDTFGTDEVYGPLLVADIRADEEASPEPLGINRSYASYLLNANENDYVLTLTLEPGSATDYAFSSYWGLFEAE